MRPFGHRVRLYVAKDPHSPARGLYMIAYMTTVRRNHIPALSMDVASMQNGGWEAIQLSSGEAEDTSVVQLPELADSFPQGKLVISSPRYILTETTQQAKNLCSTNRFAGSFCSQYNIQNYGHCTRRPKPRSGRRKKSTYRTM